MKIPTNNIFQLIQAMSAAEKRYFKRHYASEKSLLTNLFDFINRLEHYDEEQVKIHFNNTKLAKNLKVYKVQLTDLVLKSLISYHCKNNIKSKLRIGLEEIDILIEKQLYPMALSKLKKLKKLCIDNEEYEYIFPIMHFEIFLTSFYNISLKPVTYSELDEVNQYADIIKQLYTLKKINFSLQDINNNELTHEVTKETIDFYTAFLKENSGSDKQALGINEQYYLNSSFSLIHKLILKNPQVELDYKKANIQLFENNPVFVNNNPGFYFAAVYNYLSCCRKLGHYEDLEKGITDIKTLAQKFPVLQRNLMFVYYLETKHNFQLKKFKHITTHLEPLINKHIHKYGRKEDALTALTFIYFILTFLALNNTEKIHFYFRRLHAISKNLDDAYVMFINLLELVCHYESNNIFALQNLLSTHQRKIRKSNSSSSFFKDAINFFSILVKSNKNKHHELAKAWKASLDAHLNDKVYNLADEFLLDEWLTALSVEKSFLLQE